jgi:hypothetical protein
MTDVLIYWRDYRKNAERPTWDWHTNAGLLARVQPGDRLWFVTSGKNLRQVPEQAGFLVAVWRVQEVIENPGNDPAYQPENYRFRVVADAAKLVTFHDPVPVDPILRPSGRDGAASIGRFLQGPRKLSEEKVRLLKAAAGPDLALKWLTGNKT